MFEITNQIAAHVIGAVGESLNLAGAIILAADVFGRLQDHRREKGLDALHELGRACGLKTTTYSKVEVSNPEFVPLVATQRSTRMALFGVVVLCAGFVCLIGYHGLEIADTRAGGVSGNEPQKQSAIDKTF